MDYSKQKSLLERHRIESEKLKTGTSKSINTGDNNTSKPKPKFSWLYWITVILISAAIISLAVFSLMRMKGLI